MSDAASNGGAAGGRVGLELGAVQRTMLLPLWGRAEESSRRHPRLVDRAAERIVGAIDYDFGKLARSMSEISRLAWIARSLVFDGIIRRFLTVHPAATVVNIGGACCAI